MKNIVIVIVVIILGWGAYSFLNKEKIPPQNTPAAKWVNQYDAVLRKYEKSGIKNESDMNKFVAEISVFASTNKQVNIDPAEAAYYRKKLNELTARQMKLINSSR